MVIRTVDFYVDGIDVMVLVRTLIERSAWFTVDPYPDGFFRVDVKPEQAGLLQRMGFSEVRP